MMSKQLSNTGKYLNDMEKYHCMNFVNKIKKVCEDFSIKIEFEILELTPWPISGNFEWVTTEKLRWRDN